MVTVKGRGVCGGVAFGKIYVFEKPQYSPVKFTVENVQDELARFENARSEAIRRLDELYRKAAECDEESAMIFDIHKMMLEDEDFSGAVRSAVKDENVNAEVAVRKAEESFSALFSSMEDEYMRGRAADVHDISQRLLSLLSGGGENEILSDEPVILAAEDLSPSETVSLDRSKILAFVTESGSPNSHTAILARTMNIPAIVGASGFLRKAKTGDTAAADGFDGVIYIEPDRETISEMELKKERSERERISLESIKDSKAVTKDNVRINLFANVGSLEDIDAAVKCGADGVGLFRSEFIYLGRDSYPSEEEQFTIYRDAAEKLEGKRLIIRTLDIGADKTAPYLGLESEENPAMGIRAIRFCLSHPDVFKTQLRAIYRASAYGNVSVMLPMISTLSELLRAKEIISEVKNSLREEGRKFDEKAELGIMIETPSAAIISDKLAPEADFFSIGTNDLIQYTMAADRQNSGVAELCDPKNSAILRLIKTVSDNAKRFEKWVGICGDMASDDELTEQLLALGIDELSVSPFAIPKIKKKILEANVGDLKAKLSEHL